MAVWLLVLVVCGAAVLLGPVWTEIAEHATLADLLEVASFMDNIVHVGG